MVTREGEGGLKGQLWAVSILGINYYSIANGILFFNPLTRLDRVFPSSW